MLEGGSGSVDGVAFAGSLQVETDVEETHDGREHDPALCEAVT